MLPQPTPQALIHSQRVTEHIRSAIDAHAGWIDFARYMDMALYAPGLGYYAAGATKFGADGDFVTAPEISPLFGRALALQLAPIVQETQGDILELGAGSGKLAVDILLELERQHALPARYCILELSADLQARQRQTILTHAPHLAARVSWLDALPASFTGVVVANEVLDALPVHCVQWQGQKILECGVAWQGDQFVWSARERDAGPLWQIAQKLPICTDPNDAPYTSEINLAAPALIHTLAVMLVRGAMLFIDYGFPQREYYHPQRHMGTLRAHYRHHALDDPFYLPGLCDLTAHVDFSALAQAATQSGLQLAGYTSQAGFLMNAGITDLLAQTSPDNAAAYLPQANALQRLISPAEMGELFKVIAFTQNYAQLHAGFAQGDRSLGL
ncbi:MAG: class I SAM-dependent methyltransferase [Thiobacillus sp.]